MLTRLWVPDDKEDNPDTVDAFEALGGNPKDKDSIVDGQILIKIIKDDFDLTIDIEKMIKEVDDNGNMELELDEFSKLLDPKDTVRGSEDGRRALISQRRASFLQLWR